MHCGRKESGHWPGRTEWLYSRASSLPTEAATEPLWEAVLAANQCMGAPVRSFAAENMKPYSEIVLTPRGARVRFSGYSIWRAMEFESAPVAEG